jgi:hypothetical protein
MTSKNSNFNASHVKKNFNCVIAMRRSFYRYYNIKFNILSIISRMHERIPTVFPSHDNAIAMVEETLAGNGKSI